VGLELSPLGLVSTIEELLEKKNSGFSPDNREHGRRDPLHWPHGSLSPQKFALTKPTSGSCSVGILRSRTQAMEFFIGWIQSFLYFKLRYLSFYFLDKGYAKNRKVMGSSSGSDEITEFFNLPNPSGRTMTLGFTQLLTEINTRRSLWR
jgi:hypothetical protein